MLAVDTFVQKMSLGEEGLSWSLERAMLSWTREREAALLQCMVLAPAQEAPQPQPLSRRSPNLCSVSRI